MQLICQPIGVCFLVWTDHYNTIRPHSSLGYRPPAPATFLAQPS
ncbi:integrase core domain-containing protein [Chloroflexota bacterium]